LFVSVSVVSVALVVVSVGLVVVSVAFVVVVSVALVVVSVALVVVSVAFVVVSVVAFSVIYSVVSSLVFSVSDLFVVSLDLQENKDNARIKVNNIPAVFFMLSSLPFIIISIIQNTGNKLNILYQVEPLTELNLKCQTVPELFYTVRSRYQIGVTYPKVVKAGSFFILFFRLSK